MRANRLDDDTADRLLAGHLSAADAPPGYEHVAALVAAARQPGSPSERAPEMFVVTNVAAAVQANPAVGGAGPNKARLSRILTVKVAAIAAVLFFGAGAAAAATNNLPAPAQNAVSTAAERIGLEVPKAKKSNGKGPDATGPARKGLCNAAANGNGERNGVAFFNLAGAAADAGKSVEEFCADVTTTTGHVEDESEGEKSKPENKGQPEERGGPPSTAGKSADHAPVHTPNKGEGNPDAPGQTKDPGGPPNAGAGGSDNSNRGGNSDRGR